MTIAADDRGFALGDGLFETVLAEAGELAFWDQHVARLVGGCATLGLPSPDGRLLRNAAMKAIEDQGLQAVRAAVRLSWTAGSGGRGLARPETAAPRLAVTAAAAPLADTPARLITARVRRNETSPASRLKTLSYLDNVLARREAEAVGADEALMLNTHGEIACAAAANIFWIEEGVLKTPALSCGVLDGIIRARVMEKTPVVEAAAAPQALLNAEAIFVTNSLIGVRRVSQLDGRDIGGEAAVEAIRDRI